MLVFGHGFELSVDLKINFNVNKVLMDSNSSPRIECSRIVVQPSVARRVGTRPFGPALLLGGSAPSTPWSGKNDIS